MINDATPIWQLTVKEFRDIIQETAATKSEPAKTQTDEGYAYGIAGLAKLIGASKTTAQKLKSSGILDAAITQIGNKIIINKKTAIEILKKRKK